MCRFPQSSPRRFPSARGGVVGYGGVLYNAEAGEVVDATAFVGSRVAGDGGVGDGGLLRAGEGGVGKDAAAAEAGRVAAYRGVGDRQDAFTVVDAAADYGRVAAYGGATDRQGAVVVEDAAAGAVGAFPPEMVIPEMKTSLPCPTVKMRKAPAVLSRLTVS